MKPKTLTALVVAALFTATAGQARAQNRATDILNGSGLPRIEDEIVMLAGEGTGADLRVVIGAPRAAFLGRAAAVLPVSTSSRALHVEAGETIRFISGIREAVWYAGGGRVDSLLALFEVAPGQEPSLLGRDAVVLRGVAPRIAHRPAGVPVQFNQAGEFDLVSLVKVTARPQEGRAASRARRNRHHVTVWPVGSLGSLSGFVGDESDGSPLPGMRVFALDAATLRPVAAALTGMDGTFSIRRLPPGDYITGVRGLRGFESEFFDDARDPASASVITVAGGTQQTGIDFLLFHP